MYITDITVVYTRPIASQMEDFFWMELPIKLARTTVPTPFMAAKSVSSISGAGAMTLSSA